MRNEQKTICIIGLGVIGGSLALAIKKNHPKYTIIGYDEFASPKEIQKKKLVDILAVSLSAAVSTADYIFLCVPVQSILSLLPLVAQHCSSHALVTDVGSTKREICLLGSKLFAKRGNFIGGHPMTGAEGKGIAFADALLFQNATYVLCSDKRKKIQPEFIAFIQSLGSRVYVMDAKIHDKVAASISHLPQLLAVSLMNAAGAKNKKNPAYLTLAAGGFRDLTRIASSPFEMWGDILATNKDEIIASLKEFRLLLTKYETDIHSGKFHTLRSQFYQAKLWRDVIPKNSKGFLHQLYDLIVWVDDQPGVLASITSLLAKAKVNIKDIELLKIRDGVGGTFRLSFNSKYEAQRAEKALQRNFKTLQK